MAEHHHHHEMPQKSKIEEALGKYNLEITDEEALRRRTLQRAYCSWLRRSTSSQTNIRKCLMWPPLSPTLASPNW